MSVRIITDSGSDILPGEHEGLVVLPLSIMFGMDTYADGVDLSHEHFYELLVEGDDLPKTGQVNPFAFSQAFDEAADAGDDVVCITLSSKLSGTCQSAMTAAAEAKTVVRVVDSLNVCVGERILVEHALRLAAEGRTAVEISDELTELRDRVCVVALLDTLEYLRRGGRITETIYRLGSVLNIKPVLTCDEEGHYVIAKKARGWDRALDTEVKLIAAIAQKHPKVRLAVSCTSACADLYDRMEQALRERVANAVEVVRSDISPALLVHTGPNLVGVAVQGL